MQKTPQQLITLQEATEKNAHFRTGWRREDASNTKIIANPRFGEFFHLVVADAKGDPLYDVPVIVSPGGAVILPIDQSGKIGLLSHYRVCVLKASCTAAFPGLPDLKDFGRWSWETPRGFADATDVSDTETALRELSEELRVRVVRLGGELIPPLEPVGQIVTDTAYIARPVSMFVARIRRGENVERVVAETDEPIGAIRYFTPEQIRAMTIGGEILCALTRSVLWEAWARGIFF